MSEPDGTYRFMPWDDVCRKFPGKVERDEVCVMVYNGRMGTGNWASRGACNRFDCAELNPHLVARADAWVHAHHVQGKPLGRMCTL